MKSLVSIVIPVYNVELLLDRCIRSIINQTFKDIEIILVDDGSTDTSSKKCDEYSAYDNRVKVIHKKNGGLSDARNAGIAKASGDFITFIDADDFVHLDYIRLLYYYLIRYNSDISCCNYCKFSDESTLVDNIKGKTTVQNSLEFIHNFYGELRTQSIVAWGKLYKTELFNDIQYPIGKIREDEYTTYQLIAKANRVVYSDVQLYYYFQRKDSIMATKNMKIYSDYALALMERHEFWKSDSKYKEIVTIDSSFCVKDLYVPYLECLIEKSLLLSKVSEIYNCFFDSNGENYLMKYKMIRYFPYIVCLVYKIKRKVKYLFEVTTRKHLR